MIRINLLGRARPKAPRRAMPLEATLQLMLFVLSMVFAFGVLGYHWYQMKSDLKQKDEQIANLHTCGENRRRRTSSQQRVQPLTGIVRTRLVLGGSQRRLEDRGARGTAGHGKDGILKQLRASELGNGPSRAPQFPVRDTPQRHSAQIVILRTALDDAARERRVRVARQLAHRLL